jgi:hypothetical protein
MHACNSAQKYGLIVENPIPEDVRKTLTEWKAER